MGISFNFNILPSEGGRARVRGSASKKKDDG